MIGIESKGKGGPASGPARARPEPATHQAEPGELWLRLANALGSSHAAVGRSAAGDAPPAGDAGAQRPAGQKATSPFGTIVEDDVQPAPGQIRRSAFVAAAFPLIEETATQELLRAGRTAKDCPYIERFLLFYRDRPASHLERVLARYARPALTDPASLLGAIAERVRAAVKSWVASGQLELPEAATSPADGPGVQGLGGGLSADPRSVRARLGAGRALDGSTRARMERGFGRDFGEVRLHDDGRAARTATALAARAFTVGSDVAFGAGELQPGTLRGDLMLAHELAHVLQQRGGEASARGWAGPGGDALEADADRAALAAVARGGLALHELARHVAVHAPAEGGGLRLQRCGRGDADYSQAPEPPKYDQVVKDLRELYARKAVLGRADPLDEQAYDEVNEKISRRLDDLKLLGVTVSDQDIEKAITAPAGPAPLQVANARITRDPATGPLFRGRRMRFTLATDWLPPDEVAQITWRWTAGDEDQDFMYKTGTSCELDEDYFWPTIANAPSFYAVGPWRENKGTWIYARIKLGKKPPIDTPKLWVDWDDRRPDQLLAEAGFELEPAKPVLVVGEPPRVHIKGWVLNTTQYWVEWTIDGTVINLTPGLGGGVMGRPFDSPGTKRISARLFDKGDIDAKHPLATGSTTVEVQDVVTTGKQALAKGEELNAYAPLSDFRKSHDAAMDAMGTRAKLGATGSGKDYWQKRLNAERDRLASLEDRVPDFEQSKHVTGKDYSTALGAADAAAVSSTPIPTVIVYPSKGGQVVQPLSIYLMTRRSGATWTASVVDLSGSKVFKFSGDAKDTPVAAAKSAFEAWKSDNKYPTGGTLLYTFGPPGWDFPETFSTTTAWKVAEEFLDGLVELGTYLVIGLLMLAPDATVTKVLGVALMAAVAVRGAMAIKDNMAGGARFLEKENILEAIVILTAVIGGVGTAARALGSAARAGTLFRAGNWLIMTSFVVGAGTFVYATAEALAALREILRDRTLTDADRSSRLLSIIGGLIANGAMMIISGKALLQGGLKASDFFKETIPARGSGPIEMSEGMRIDLEVELRKRGVAPEALKQMSPEVLLDNYYNLTATKPELVKIPEAYKTLPGKEAAARMRLPTPPKGYAWSKNGDRLTVAKNRNFKGDKLVYDPNGQPGKEFIVDPTTVSPKPFVTPAVEVVPGELQASAAKAVAARDAITGVPGSKTVARTADGTTTLSGWGKDVNSLEPVEKLSAEIGHEPALDINDAPGKPGSYNYSHAEKQLAARKPGEPIGVSREMCLDCQTFFAKLATKTGKPVVVADPKGVRVFLPNQPMVTAPNAAAVPGIVAAANQAKEGAR